MLDPQNRRLLLESLRPPAGYKLDAAVGTTYSLDLLALMTAPLAFSLFDWEDNEGRPMADPLALLEAVRRNADRLSIFCQAGEIKVPGQNRRLLALLEECVIEVAPRKGGIFHPKVWVLRFAADASPTLYRLLCLSRNLTFDQCWDTILVLEGALLDRQKAIAASHPVADFIEALPRLALRPLTERVSSQLERIQDELRRVRFEVPAAFDEIAFWPLGLSDKKRWPLGDRIDRALVISPFLSDGLLNRLSDDGEGHVLVSRIESLQAVAPETLHRFSSLRILREGAEGEPVDGDGLASELALRGLHAKAYVIDRGWDASVFTGSANATDPAFGQNVEFLVELKGKKSRCGVEAFLAMREGESTLASLLEEIPQPSSQDLPDLEARAVEELLREVRQTLWRAQLSAYVGTQSGDVVELHLAAREPLPLPQGAQIRCWPVTVHEDAARPLGAVLTRVDLGPQSADSLTSFFAFDVQLQQGTKTGACRFVLNLPLIGAPADRRQRLLRSLLRDREQVLRLLLLLLSNGGLDARELLQGGEGADEGGRSGVFSERQLFESLMRTLDREPARLDDVANLVADLQGNPETSGLLPEGLAEIWAPIAAVRQRLKSGRRPA
jgi:hypothetical protein